MTASIWCRSLASFMAGSAMLVAAPGAARAAPDASKVTLHIAAQPLGLALNEFARQSRQQILFTSDLVAGKQGRRLDGSYSPSGALSALLARTGLAFRAGAGGVYVLAAAP